MLITPNMPSGDQISQWANNMRKHGIMNWQYNPPVVLADGLIIGHLNVNHDLKTTNKFEEYPVFHHDEFMIRLIRQGLTDENQNIHQKTRNIKELAKYEAVPSNIQDLYHKENWRHIYEREFRYDTPEVRQRMVEEEGRTFENYEPYLGPYGVIDTPEQILTLYNFESDPRKFFINFTEMRKDEQPDCGGWRWHKWGEYLGTQNPQCEYLYDEPEIELVYVFHIYQLID